MFLCGFGPFGHLPSRPRQALDGDFAKFGVPFWGVPTIRIRVFWGLDLGPPPILGNYQTIVRAWHAWSILTGSYYSILGLFRDNAKKRTWKLLSYIGVKVWVGNGSSNWVIVRC